MQRRCRRKLLRCESSMAHRGTAGSTQQDTRSALGAIRAMHCSIGQKTCANFANGRQSCADRENLLHALQKCLV